MKKKIEAVALVVLVLVAVVVVGTLMNIHTKRQRVINRVVGEQMDQLRFEGYDPDRGVVRVRIVE